jgi:hypothetical protein
VYDEHSSLEDLMRTSTETNEAVIKVVFAGAALVVSDELTAILGRLKDGSRSREGRADVVEFALAGVYIGEHRVRVRIHGLSLASPADKDDEEILAGADALALLLDADEVEPRALVLVPQLREQLTRLGALGDGTPMTLFVVGPQAAVAAHSVHAEVRAKGSGVSSAGSVDGLQVLQNLCEQVVTWHRDPLSVLAARLPDGRVPRRWFEAHGPAFEKLWHDCTDGRVLIRIAAKVFERAAVARAACACARAALSDAGGTKSAEHALAVAEAWARGTANAQDVKTACGPLFPLVAADSDDLALAIVMAGGVCEKVEYAETAVDAAARVLSANQATVVNPSLGGVPLHGRRSKGEALAELATVIRAHVEVPTMEAIRSAAEKLGGR